MSQSKFSDFTWRCCHRINNDFPFWAAGDFHHSQHTKVWKGSTYFFVCYITIIYLYHSVLQHMVELPFAALLVLCSFHHTNPCSTVCDCEMSNWWLVAWLKKLNYKYKSYNFCKMLLVNLSLLLLVWTFGLHSPLAFL